MLNASDLSDVHVKIPLAMLNRHGLVAGATGTGKTKTLQRMAEPEKSMVEEVVTSTAFRQVMRTAAREIVRGMFKTGRR